MPYEIHLLKSTDLKPTLKDNPVPALIKSLNTNGSTFKLLVSKKGVITEIALAAVPANVSLDMFFASSGGRKIISLNETSTPSNKFFRMTY